MSRGSVRYVDLRNRLAELRQHLLNFLPSPPQSRTSYTNRELDLTRSFIILAHAEIEAFCEDLALARAHGAKQAFDGQGKVTTVLRRVVAYYVGRNRVSWSEVKQPSAKIVGSAFQAYFESIQTNNGIKRYNLEKLFFPLGVAENSLDAAWLAQMDSFGANRGGWAHKSMKALNPPDPGSESAAVTELLKGLLQLDRMVCRMR